MEHQMIMATRLGAAVIITAYNRAESRLLRHKMRVKSWTYVLWIPLRTAYSPETL
jgi:hypothetical protein